jgi:hypothetical protein
MMSRRIPINHSTRAGLRHGRIIKNFTVVSRLLQLRGKLALMEEGVSGTLQHLIVRQAYMTREKAREIQMHLKMTHLCGPRGPYGPTHESLDPNGATSVLRWRRTRGNDIHWDHNGETILSPILASASHPLSPELEFQFASRYCEIIL